MTRDLTAAQEGILLHRSWIAAFGVVKGSIPFRYVEQRDEKGKPEFYRVSRLDVIRHSFAKGVALADFAEKIPVSCLAEPYRRFKAATQQPKDEMVTA